MIEGNDVIFVYGTLMKGETNSHFLDNSLLLGHGTIKGYELLQLDGYPGIIPGNGIVAGELYSIDIETKKQLDILEGDEYKYSLGVIDTDDTQVQAYFYEFIKEKDMRYPLAYTIDNRWVDISNYVWYACYGSNLLDERFNRYIAKTSAKQVPLTSQSVLLPYKMYFANNSKRWNQQGVAFLDTDVLGDTYGWMYLITKEQFNEIKEFEGKWYSREIKISSDDLGIDVLTFTSPYRYEDVLPSQEYIEVIGAGLKEKYHFSDKVIDEYLGVKDYDYSLIHIKEILKDK